MIAVKNETERNGVNMEVFRRYSGLTLPRHVAYPMPTWWESMTVDDTCGMYAGLNESSVHPDLSLYIHIPFCEKLCKFCACHRIIIGPNNDEVRPQVDRYLDALEKDIRRLSDTFGQNGVLRQIHWGGGSPTYLESDQIERIQTVIGQVFNIADQAEIAMEVDPRTGTVDKLKTLKRLGFTRLSIGVQDFDEKTQEHVRRVQPFEMVRDYTKTCRELGFDSVNFDLIYGMPYQTPETVRTTVEKTLEIGPDRIAFYHYAQIPDKIATQRGMSIDMLPSSETKLEMFLIGLSLFESAGYEFVGLDHFAKADEALATSLKEGTIQRNFQGMTTGGDLSLLGAGCSSISNLPGIGFLQNIKDVDEYVEAMEAGKMPVVRGKHFTQDDLIRQSVLADLYCAGRMDPAVIESRYGIDFSQYFASEMKIVTALVRDGLVTVDEAGVIEVTKPLGGVLLRNIAAVFDGYLDKEAYRKGEHSYFSVSA